MPSLEFAMLADHARVADGLLYVNGGTFSEVRSSGEGPHPVSGSLVLAIDVTAAERGRSHLIEIRLIDEDGDEFFSSAVEFTVDRAAPTNQRRALLTPGIQLLLPKLGGYTFHILINGNDTGGGPSFVISDEA